jgi:hypothetical protein
LDAKVIRRGKATEYYVTVASAVGDLSPATVQAAYRQIARYLAAQNVQVIQERAYGLREARQQIARAREAAFLENGLDSTIPFSFIEGAPLRGSAFGGVQLWGAAFSQPEQRVTTLNSKTGQPIGRLWNGPDFRLLFLPGVTGAAADGSLAGDPSQQAAAMFRNADARLAFGGFSYAQVTRTWIYLARLLD